jgi:MFS family permease
MGQAIQLLRTEPRARLFFAALAQSSLGTGAAYVALLLLAYQRLESPWAVSLILLADFLPAMFLGPLLGAAADRWSRRGCAVVADALRAAAFLALTLVGSFELTVLFALLAGVGTALFKPAVLAGMPVLVSRERTASATSLYGAITDVGYTAGPAIAGAALIVMSPGTLLAANAATFALSAVVLARLPLDDADRRAKPRPARATLFAEARRGLRATAGMPGIRVLILVSAGTMFFGGMFNVAELPFAKVDLGTSGPGFSAMVTLFGLGFVLGSLRGSAGGAAHSLKRRYLTGLLVMGISGTVVGVAPSLVVVAVPLALAGFGNGLFLVHERLLIQSEVSQELQGRVFAITDSLVSWGFATAFLCAGALTDAAGARPVVLATGLGTLTLACAATLALRRQWVHEPAGGDVVAASAPGLSQ